MFDLDYVRSHISKQHSAIRPGCDVAELDNPDSVKWQFHLKPSLIRSILVPRWRHPSSCNGRRSASHAVCAREFPWTAASPLDLIVQRCEHQVNQNMRNDS